MARTSAQQLDLPRGPLWFKVTGMLEQNWAMVVETSAVDSSAQMGVTILFFDDHGLVFDELQYANALQADHALAFNGFTPLSEQPGFRTVAGLPKFPLTRLHQFERPVYSSGEYWWQPPDLKGVKSRRTLTPEGLERFVQAQTPVIDTAMKELRAGRKETHWMWFVFPQLYGLGYSRKAQMYGILDLDEARAYLAHPLLGRRLHECFRLVLLHRDRSAQQIFGRVDAMKFRSCATLFERASATPHSVFALALQQYFANQPDPKTIGLLLVS